MKLVLGRQGFGRIWKLVVIALLCVGLITGGVYRFQTAPLSVEPTVQVISQPRAIELKPLSWPSYGQAAIASEGYGVLMQHGDSKPQSTASTAKLITMLAVIKAKPFDDGAGAEIIFSKADAERYHSYVAGNGSAVEVGEGWRWTQYQAMQAVLLESANNVSDSLAIWAFGSLPEYRKYAQKMVQELGMNDTTVGRDASGYDPSTTSTAADMARLGLAAAKNPVLAEITAQASATLPNVGEITNSNLLLQAQSDVFGAKTGFIYESGGAFVLTGRQTDGDNSQVIVTAVLGAPGVFREAALRAQNDAFKLFVSAKKNFAWREIVVKDQELGSYQPAWVDDRLVARADRSLAGFVWLADQPAVVTQLQPVQAGTSEKTVGQTTVKIGKRTLETTAVLDESLEKPSMAWRIVRW